jgi:pteridine reductase
VKGGNHTLILKNTQAHKVALVTGGARRIGAAIAKSLHQAGYTVAVHCHHSLTQAQELVNAFNKARKDSALVLQQDLTAPNAADAIVQALRHWTGRLDVLIHNASVFKAGEKDWDLLFHTNVKAPQELSCAARSLLTPNQGVIINISDIHAQKPLKAYSVYCQSKAALEMQTKALALEFAPEIRVNAVAPGPSIWPEGENTLSEEEQAKITAKTLLLRHGAPQYIAHAVLSLVENPYITGQILQVDGGRSVKNA